MGFQKEEYVIGIAFFRFKFIALNILITGKHGTDREFEDMLANQTPIHLEIRGDQANFTRRRTIFGDEDVQGANACFSPVGLEKFLVGVREVF